jgi:hypothetical protein
LTRPSTRIAGPELVCDTRSSPIDIRSPNLPAATDSGESMTALASGAMLALVARSRGQESICLV